MANIIAPPPDRTAGEWADSYRTLPPDSPEPGKWRTSRVPFWRPIYAAALDPRAKVIVVVTGAQMAKTESMLNIIGQRMTDGPYVPALYVGPTEKNARSISRDRFDKMLRSTPVLWERTEKGNRYSTYEKWIAGVRLGFAWAGSATELASHPAGLVMVDERDRMSSDVDGEGDPVALARARTKNYPLGKVFVFSTPTVEGASPIWSLFESGTMMKWGWTCLGCATPFVPSLALLKWPEGATPAEAMRAAYVECPHCLHRHVEGDKSTLNAAGAYIPHELDKEGNHVARAEPIDSPTWSYWVSGLASPWAAFGDVAAVLIQAYKTKEQETIQAQVNTWGGEVFRVRGEAPEWAEVAARRGEYSARQVVDGVQLITLGADVQKYGIYYVVRGWGFNLESWLLEANFIAGETEYDNVWVTLGHALRQTVGDRYIDRAFIDSGYRPGDRFKRPDHAVYTFCRRNQGLAWPTKGHSDQDTPIKIAAIDITVGGRLVKQGVKLAHLDTDFFKRWIHSRIRWPAGEPGEWHLYRDTTEDYCRQLVAEELMLKASGRATWIKRSNDNHFLDCEVGATAAAWSLNAFKLPTFAEFQAAQITQSDPGGSPENNGDAYSRRDLF